MKISDEAAPLRRPEPQPSAPSASHWLAELERAWLQDWPASRSGPPSAAGPGGRTDASAQASPPTVNEAEASSKNGLGDIPSTASSPSPDAGAPAAPSAERSNEAAATSTRDSQPAEDRAMTAGGARSLTTLARVSPDLGQRRPQAAVLTLPVTQAVAPAMASAGSHAIGAATAAVLAATPQPTAAISFAPHVRYVAMPPEASAGEAEAQPQAQQEAQGHPGPSRLPERVSLQVAVADSAAQVTLRDASLTQADVALTGQALADQLIGLGLQSVRVYVNGVASQHGPRRTQLADAPSRGGESPARTDSLSPTPITLERK